MKDKFEKYLLLEGFREAYDNLGEREVDTYKFYFEGFHFSVFYNGSYSAFNYTLDKLATERISTSPLLTFYKRMLGLVTRLQSCSSLEELYNRLVKVQILVDYIQHYTETITRGEVPYALRHKYEEDLPSVEEFFEDLKNKNIFMNKYFNFNRTTKVDDTYLVMLESLGLIKIA
jgi:hypothetical protein